MTTKNTNKTTVNAAYVVNTAQKSVKLMMTTSKKEAANVQPAKHVAGIAKNTRYSLNSNGGGYMGL